MAEDSAWFVEGEVASAGGDAVVEAPENSQRGGRGGEVVVEVVGLGLAAIEREFHMDCPGNPISVHVGLGGDIVSVVVGSKSYVGPEDDVNEGLVVVSDKILIEADDRVGNFGEDIVEGCGDVEGVVGGVEDG